jgi:hypothetical protein
MIPDHRHGSVLWTLDAAIRRHLAAVEDTCSAAVNGNETTRFLREALQWLQRYLTHDRSPWRSEGLWRLDGQRKIPEDGEQRLAYELSQRSSGLYLQIPATSGVVDWKGQQNRHANVDIVREVNPTVYELIELKDASDTPEFAAAELVRNALLYLVAKNFAPEAFCKAIPLLQATKISLQVWAAADYYDGYDGQRLQSAITKGFTTLTGGLISDFAFSALDNISGKTTGVDWANARNRQRRELRHVAGPFRKWLRRKLVNAPRPLLFDPAWRNLLQSEHFGFESPDSSQAFALNIFAPFVHNSDLAREVLNRLLPGVVSAQEEVTVLFEQSFADVAKHLNEQGIATQVDVVFSINGTGPARRLLIEVKLAEEHFGSCKGWLANEMNGLVDGGLGFAPKTVMVDNSLDEKIDRSAVAAARRKFAPEFMNRIDKLVVFKTLRPEHLKQILDIELGMVQQRVLMAAGAQCR